MDISWRLASHPLLAASRRHSSGDRGSGRNCNHGHLFGESAVIGINLSASRPLLGNRRIAWPECLRDFSLAGGTTLLPLPVSQQDIIWGHIISVLCCL